MSDGRGRQPFCIEVYISMNQLVLFDLDGTLTESGEGIMKSVQYALRKLGKEAPDWRELRAFVGPPLIGMFMQYAGFDRETAEQGVVYYREYFQEKGIFENALYPGIKEMLESFKKQGLALGIASSKPEPYVLKVTDYFDITKYFDVITGSTMAETRTKKSEVIEEALRRYAPEEDIRENAVMVGDKSHDILGAREAGLRCVGVLYGYGTKEEIEGAEPFAVAGTVEELSEILLNL